MPTPPPDASPAEISIVASSENGNLGLAALPDAPLWGDNGDAGVVPDIGDLAASGELDIDSDEYIDLLQGLADAGEPSGAQSTVGGVGDLPASDAAIKDDQPEAGPSVAVYVDVDDIEDGEGHQASGDLTETGDEAYPDRVADDDNTFFGLLIQDLKECIDEPAWTLKLWSDVFTNEVSSLAMERASCAPAAMLRTPLIVSIALLTPVRLGPKRAAGQVLPTCRGGCTGIRGEDGS